MKTYEQLLGEALSKIPDTLDKREGSIIYDALSPACYVLAGYYMDIELYKEQSSVSSTYGSYLDEKVKEQGLTRITATKALKKGTFTFDNEPAVIAIGTRFSTLNNDSLIYCVESEISAGNYALRCETAGMTGNNYMGDLVPISNGIKLDKAVMSELIVAARETETDDELRARFYDSVNKSPFGGNIAQYKENLLAIEGIGDAQIYPTWNGGGTVKCSVVAADYSIVSEQLINQVQIIMDPQEFTGKGLGIAPIGHTVTICTPSEKQISVTCTLDLTSGTNLSSIQSEVEKSIQQYLLNVRKEWGSIDTLKISSIYVYYSQIMAAILSTSGVANVRELSINGGSSDIILQETAKIQEVPSLKEVVISGI